MTINLTLDSWLSEQLECNAYHLKNDFETLTENDFPSGDIFIDVKVEITKRYKLNNLIKLGFQLIETNAQFKRQKCVLNLSSPTCRFAEPEDKIQIENIAAYGFTKTRFHSDPKIPTSKANLIQKNWVGNFFNGTRGKWLVVSEINGEIAGFNQILEGSSNEIIIDLIAVREENRGQGLGKQMISYANSHCGNSNATIKVGTELSNTDSIRFYERLGFLFEESFDVYHYHSA